MSAAEYQVHYSVDGILAVVAESPEAAQRLAIDALESVDCDDAESFQVDGCTVKVAARTTTDGGYESLDSRTEVVEFAS